VGGSCGGGEARCFPRACALGYPARRFQGYLHPLSVCHSHLLAKQVTIHKIAGVHSPLPTRRTDDFAGCQERHSDRESRRTPKESGVRRKGVSPLKARRTDDFAGCPERQYNGESKRTPKGSCRKAQGASLWRRNAGEADRNPHILQDFLFPASSYCNNMIPLL